MAGINNALWRGLYEITETYSAKLSECDLTPGNEQLVKIWQDIGQAITSLAGCDYERFPLCMATLTTLENVQRFREGEPIQTGI